MKGMCIKDILAKRGLVKSVAYGAVTALVSVGLCLPFTPVHAANGNQIGIATSATLPGMNKKALNNRLDDIQNLGASWIRVDFNWSAIQPTTRDSYKWGAYDRVVKAANQHNLQILATLVYTPPWARNPTCALVNPSEEEGRKCSPSNIQDFGRFAGTAALRYKRLGLHAWEIWNEPNLVGYWKTILPNDSAFVDPRAYARTANAAARQIRQIDPHAFTITGGLSPVFEPHYPGGMRQSDYLLQLLPHLQRSLFNAVGIHPYTWPKMPRLAANYNAFYTVDNGPIEYDLRSIMAHAGWGDAQIWATEFGASTLGTGTTSNPVSLLQKRPDHVSEDSQAQIIQQGIDDWHIKSNVGPLFVHSDSDQWLSDQKNEGGFGLRRRDGSKKPAYDSFQSATAQLR